VVLKKSRIFSIISRKVMLERSMDLEIIPSSKLVVSMGLYGLGKIAIITERLTVNCRVQVFVWILKNIVIMLVNI